MTSWRPLPNATHHRWVTELLAEQKGDLAPVCRGLAKLVVVDIALSRDQDNPQLIFESMNSTGKELSQADLIRNFILMGLDPGRQTRLYEEYWRPMELDFGQEAYGTQFDSFMRHYLTVRTGDMEILICWEASSRSTTQGISGSTERKPAAGSAPTGTAEISKGVQSTARQTSGALAGRLTSKRWT